MLTAKISASSLEFEWSLRPS